EPGIRSMGGAYFRVKEGEPTGWNPAALPPTKRNISFMKDLVRLLCTLNSEPLDDYQNRLISDAVERLMQRSNRSYPISKLRPLILEPDDTETRRHGLKARLNAWVQGGEFGWVFDNPDDTFDVDNLDVFGIDGTEFLDNKVLSSAASFYL
ncbi:conjugal transfer protein, partial [Neisseria meningitidis]|nr:conjugal transfer protein [Neisseria meningitidis]